MSAANPDMQENLLPVLSSLTPRLSGLFRAVIRCAYFPTQPSNDVNVFGVMSDCARKLLYPIIFVLALGIAPILKADSGPNSHKVCLVLSGGGARAAAHIGILKVLEKEGIKVDCIAGTSLGALVGGLYSLGYSPSDIEKFLTSQDWNNIFSDAPQRRLMSLIERRDTRYQGQIAFRGWNPELPSGLWGGQRLAEALDVLTTHHMLRAQYDFDKLPVQFRAVATNLIDGKPYIFKKGSMTQALRASMAVPLLFTPLEHDGKLLVDGGLVNNLPADIAREMGADIIIAVDATSPLLTGKELRTFFDVIDQSISLQMEKNVRENLKLATLVLKPKLEEFTNVDYDKLPEIIKRGEEEANRQLTNLKSLTAGVSPHPRIESPLALLPIIDLISFQGLKQIPVSQLKKNVHIHAGDKADAEAIGADVGRIYATRLFESITYNLEPIEGNRYRLIFVLKEALLNTMGASLRYDTDYNFVALAEFTARQVLNTPSTATISSQFGGLENHFAAFRFVLPSAPFLFLEPRVDASRLERLDIQDQKQVDRYTDKREGAQLLVGAIPFRQLELSGGYRYERVRISGGSESNNLAASPSKAGIVFRLNWDSLDDSEFPRSGRNLKFQVDKQSKIFGADLNYSRWQANYTQYFSISGKSTVQIHADAGYSKGLVPFYDLFFIGGYSFSEKASNQFLGLDRDEFPVRQMTILSASYRRQIFARPLSLIKSGYITGTYNGGFFSTYQEAPYHFRYFNGVGVGLGVDTMLGPLQTAIGWGEGGRFNFHLSFGPTF
jgi:NTE family protein